MWDKNIFKHKIGYCPSEKDSYLPGSFCEAHSKQTAVGRKNTLRNKYNFTVYALSFPFYVKEYESGI